MSTSLVGVTALSERFAYELSMELKRLRDFLALSEELHYERAAIRVGTDQSGLSRRIRELERDLGGVKLFTRTTRGTKISAAGTAFLPFARGIIGKMEQAERAVREAAAGVREQLRIGVCDELPVNKLADLIAAFRIREPTVDAQLLDRSCVGLIQDLQAGVLDIGLTLGSPDDRDLRATELWTDRTCIMLPSKHPLAKEDAIDIKAVAHERLIVAHRECSCGARANIDLFIRAANVRAEIEDAANLNVLRTLVRAGQGVGFVSTLQAQAIDPTDVTCRPLRDSPALFRTFVLCRREDDSPFALRFFDLARRTR